MQVYTLFSGSSGNCVYVKDKNTEILIDAGKSAGAIEKSLTALDSSLYNIKSIFLTHEHTDHVSALCQVVAKNPQIKVFAHAKGLCAIKQRTTLQNVHPIENHFCFCDISVETIECSHDSCFCCGYKFSDKNGAVGIISDTGCEPNGVVDFLCDCKTVLIESNHDELMLKSGKYPFLLKQRILSRNGHLSNAQCGKILFELFQRETSVKNVVLGHLSQQNNIPELAFCEAVQVLRKNGIIEGRDVNLVVALQNERSQTFD